MPGTRIQHTIPRLILAPVAVMDLKYQQLAANWRKCSRRLPNRFYLV